ncbi:Putative deoxyribonuclease YcfH [Labilithrix luteola]|uniref:Putative deoxyribonuclease YcfH n=1 Tax=Labilithrix luteola TaxID=1391654 RepID=A0A0K1PQV6_9BACT|nr:TatD family hydrolase [Labilithrix luteola]AKU95499.1 Putative deoxyribonuclease YcfH [Labilithrix luteola]
MHRSVFDSHAHLQDARVTDPASVWARAREAGVRRVLLAGVDADDWDRQAALAHLPGIYQSVGIHPQVAAVLGEAERASQLERLERALVQRSPGVVAIGEIGMDGVGERRLAYGAQAELFEAQLRLAKAHDLPIILHVLRAHEEALKILEAVGVPAAGGVVHSYSGSPELVPRYLEHGLYLSFSGSITWHEGGRAARAVKACPVDRLLVETDAPDQTPLDHRPEANEPTFLTSVVRSVATIVGAPASEIAETTYRNACRAFRIEES